MRSKILVGAAATLAALFLGSVPVGANDGGPPPVQCNKTINGGTINNNVQVPNSGVCVLNGVTVNGSVTAGSNAYFESNGSKISGNILGNQSLTLYVWNHSKVGGNVAGFQTPQLFVYDSTVGQSVGAAASVASGYGHFQVCGSTIGDSIGVALMGPDILIGDPAAGCGSNTVKNGDIAAVFNSTDNELYVIGNSLPQGSLTVYRNTGVGDKRVQNNSLPSGGLNCVGNSSPFTASGNTAASGHCP